MTHHPVNPGADEILREVRSNLLAQPIGAATVGDLALPDDFVLRLCGRVIRDWYHDHLRRVVVSPGSPTIDSAPVPGGSGNGPHPRVIEPPEHTRSGLVASYRASVQETRPALRNFRAPILDQASLRQPLDLSADAPSSLRAAAATIARSLSPKGLLRTLAEAITTLNNASPVSHLIESLQAAGFPVDLLRFFTLDSSSAPTGTGDSEQIGRVVEAIRQALVQGNQAVDSLIAQAALRFTPTLPNARFLPDSSQHPLGTLRLQLTSSAYWAGKGGGGSLDIARQLVAALPDVNFLVSVERKHLDPLIGEVRTWPLASSDRFTIIPEDLTVGEWAQDNMRPAAVGNGPQASLAALTPRYASRGEEGATFVPGESFLMDGVAAAGVRIAQSPLLFQGGNIQLVELPDSRRLLFVGEAEVWRNVSLGLSPDQARESLRIEFGAQEIEVLPAASFHIDQEVSFRVLGDRLLAFVNDSTMASTIVVRLGLDVLERTGTLPRAAARSSREALGAARHADWLSIVGQAVFRSAVAPGQFPFELARRFAAGPTDSGVGNFHRFLLAMDYLASQAFAPRLSTLQPADAAYLASFQRRDADRSLLHDRLRTRGFALVPVPSLSEGNRGICPINGIHDRTRYLMPAYGGLYTPLDDAAAAAFRKALGPSIKVIQILCGESQRRQGALHCAAAAFPRIETSLPRT